LQKVEPESLMGNEKEEFNKTPVKIHSHRRMLSFAPCDEYINEA